MKKVIIIGAGPGGLAAGMLLSAKGYKVHIYEKDSVVGGRMQPMVLKDHTFDTGPTFLMEPGTLKHVFELANENLEDHLELIKVDPLYEFLFKNKNFKPTTDKEKMRKEMERVFPAHVVDYFDFLDRQDIKHQKLKPLWRSSFNSVFTYFNPMIFRSLWYRDTHSTVFKRLKKRFTDEDLVHAMSFQTKYLGMSPFKAPGMFTILSYLEFSKGLFHVKGGLHQIALAMQKIIEKNGGKIHLNKPVKRLIIRKKKAYGVAFEDDTVDTSKIIINDSDFSYFAKNLIPKKHQRKYKNKHINKLKHSLSLFVMYLALDKTYNLAHHTMIFADNPTQSIKALTEQNNLPFDLTVYVHNPSKMDKTLTKNKTHSSLTISVAVPNTKADIDWTTATNAFRKEIITRIQDKTHINDLEDHIIAEKIITPSDWEKHYNLHQGATFGLAHTKHQVLHNRPNNRYRDTKHVYLVGAGTHPGGGLMSVFQSAILTTKKITNT